MKEKIFKALGGIPADSLYNYIQQDVVTYQELSKHCLTSNPDKLIQLNSYAWKVAQQKKTVEGYDKYLTLFPTGDHVKEASKELANLDDDYWEDILRNISEHRLKEYLRIYPSGKHVEECKKHLEELLQKPPLPPTPPTPPTISVLDNIRKNRNKYSARELQNFVKQGTVTWPDLMTVFDEPQVNAIKAWEKATDLPRCQPPEELKKDSTEVYFWGTKKTGKTCAIGAVLSYAKKNGILVAQNCRHRTYLDQLSNSFMPKEDSTICNLPESTQKNSISELNMYLIDDKEKKHQITFIDLAGEMVTGIYKMNNNIPLLDSERATINQILSYLKNPYNNKIHFFVLEYGKSNEEVKELRDLGYTNVHQVDILTSIVDFLDKQGGLNKSTVGVYGLVTKSDDIDLKLGTSPDERPRLAHEYVDNNLKSFWKAINIACKGANVKDLKTISFSIGNVFAQNFCFFDGSDSKKIINRLLLKTKPEPGGCLKWLFQ